ncbi:hypothetical protein TNCV_4231141 [Trichonephila clavipes]|uniref:Uncharacterized protein n=1 Tax=Trichonephila clavipes TaxID=2585209 RepID=A0A8X6VM85_TRICX|nr:hypothetical protein TNCV_4231141 [Trichonephila clavipes]
MKNDGRCLPCSRKKKNSVSIICRDWMAPAKLDFGAQARYYKAYVLGGIQALSLLMRWSVRYAIGFGYP